MVSSRVRQTSSSKKEIENSPVEASAIQIPKEEVPSGPLDDSYFILAWPKTLDVRRTLIETKWLGSSEFK